MRERLIYCGETETDEEPPNLDFSSKFKLICMLGIEHDASMRTKCGYQRWQVYAKELSTCECVCVYVLLNAGANLIPNKHFRHSHAHDPTNKVTAEYKIYAFFPFPRNMCCVSFRLIQMCVCVYASCFYSAAPEKERKIIK